MKMGTARQNSVNMTHAGSGIPMAQQEKIPTSRLVENTGEDVLRWLGLAVRLY